MTAVRPVLELYIDLNIVLMLSALLWFGTRSLLRRSTWRFAFPTQLKALKLLFVCVLLSPLLAASAAYVVKHLWSGGTIAVGDLAVAAYLRGDIAMQAIEFEALLNTRQRWIDTLFAGDSILISALVAFFAIGTVFLSVKAARAAWAIHGTICDSYLWRRTKRVDIRISDRVSVPFATRGLFRRHVVLPSDMVIKPSEMQFALVHEFQHLRDSDVEWELLFELVRPLFFWNPAYLALKDQFERLRELSCDQSVVTRKGMDTLDYTNCLLDYCARGVTGEGPRVMNVALVGSGKAKQVLRQRVLALGNAPASLNRSPAPLIGCASLFAICLAIGYASIHQPDDWSHDRLMLSAVVNLERLEAINNGQ